MLLWPNHHSRTHETHECNHFVGSEAVAIDQISSDQAASPTEARLAMDSDALILRDHVVGQLDELVDNGECWTGSILKDHIDVLDAKSCKVCWAVKLGVESNDQTNIAPDEMSEDVLEWLGYSGTLDFWYARWQSGIGGR